VTKYAPGSTIPTRTETFYTCINPTVTFYQPSTLTRLTYTSTAGMTSSLNCGKRGTTRVPPPRLGPGIYWGTQPPLIGGWPAPPFPFLGPYPLPSGMMDTVGGGHTRSAETTQTYYVTYQTIVSTVWVTGMEAWSNWATVCASTSSGLL
jgi:hypothetical protein